MSGPRYVKDFEFPVEAGFSGSATNRTTVPVKSHERRRPVKKAMGGPVQAAQGGAARKGK